jgi:glycosyltransferase involved in cell wall biosynthesis
MPRFTIITATRGRPQVLREALRSALAQEYEDFEHLVVDDASEDDGAKKVVAELQDPRIRLIRLDRSRGPAGARNAAVTEARGEWCAILDDDDVMLPGRLAASAAAFDARPDAVLVASSFRAIDGKGNVLADVPVPKDEARFREMLPRSNPLGHSTCAVRTTILRGLGGYREPLRYGHDYDMILRVAEKGAVVLLPAPLLLYRFHIESVTAQRCFLQGAFAEVARECARRRARGEPERLEEQVAAIRVPEGAPLARAKARVHYQIAEWQFRAGRVREARPHLFAALRGEPFRPLCLGMLVASYAPLWLRRAVGPVVRPLVAMRYPSWRA